MPMLALGEVQAAFRRALLDGDDGALAALVAADGIAAAKRLAVYRNNVQISLTDALRDTFPAVCRLVDERFFAYAAHAFLTGHPPQRACLAEYGAGFADFLAAFPPCRALVYLPDVPRLMRCCPAAWPRRISPAGARWPPPPGLRGRGDARPRCSPRPRLAARPPRRDHRAPRAFSALRAAVALPRQHRRGVLEFRPHQDRQLAEHGRALSRRVPRAGAAARARRVAGRLGRAPLPGAAGARADDAAGDAADARHDLRHRGLRLSRGLDRASHLGVAAAVHPDARRRADIARPLARAARPRPPRDAGRPPLSGAVRPP